MKRTRPDPAQGPERLIEGRLAEQIIEYFFAVYDDLEFGMFESTYRNALAAELAHHGLNSRKEVPIEVCYRGVEVGHFRLDLLVADKVAVEVSPPRSSRPSPLVNCSTIFAPLIWTSVCCCTSVRKQRFTDWYHRAC